jgi:hypothetical protein
MEPQPSQAGFKLLPSLADFAFLAPIAFLFGRMDGVKTLLGDGDTGWHIRTGEWILANHRVPTQDMFSFTRPGDPWYAWEWLSDVLFAWLNRVGGMAAVLLLAVAMLAVVFALVFRMVRKRSNPLVAIMVTLVAAVASSVHWLARPHLFTLLFAVLFYGALERVREGRTRVAGIPLLALLPVAMILWTNVHGGFFVGIILIAGYGFGEALGSVLATDRGERRSASLRAGRYFATAAACAAATLVNPYGWRLHAHILQYLRNPYQFQHISEFLSLNFHHPLAAFVEGLLLASVAASFWYASRRSFVEPVLLLGWAHAALIAGRNIPIFAIVAAPLVANAIEQWLTRLPEWNVAGWLRSAVGRFNALAARTADTDSFPRWHAASAAGLVLVAVLLYAPAPPPKFRPEYDPGAYPAGAVKLLAGDRSARIFTTDVWGGYLIYRLYPGTRVFMDGRSDFYGQDLCQHYLDILNVKYDWERMLDSFRVNTILLPASVPLAGALKQSSRWRVVYDDHVALVFQSRGKSTMLSAAVRGAACGAPNGVGPGRDREITKTAVGDRGITELKPKT